METRQQQQPFWSWKIDAWAVIGPEDPEKPDPDLLEKKGQRATKFMLQSPKGSGLSGTGAFGSRGKDVVKG